VVITPPRPQQWGFPRRIRANRLKGAMRGRNVAKECSNNNEICCYAWNIYGYIQARATDEPTRDFG